MPICQTIYPVVHVPAPLFCLETGPRVAQAGLDYVSKNDSDIPNLLPPNHGCEADIKRLTMPGVKQC